MQDLLVAAVGRGDALNFGHIVRHRALRQSALLCAKVIRFLTHQPTRTRARRFCRNTPHSLCWSARANPSASLAGRAVALRTEPLGSRPFGLASLSRDPLTRPG